MLKNVFQTIKSARHQLGFAHSVLRQKPFQCLIQLTHRCNMKCSFCSFWSKVDKAGTELQLEDYRKIANELAKEGRFLVSLEGGEPLLRQDCEDIVRVFSERHMTILYTNGWLMTPNRALALFESGLSHIGVSIDFPDAHRHDGKRGKKGAFDRAIKATQMLRDAAPKRGKQVHLMTVMMRDNQRDLTALLELSRELSVGHGFTLLSTKGAVRGGEQLPDSDVAQGFSDLFHQYPHILGLEDYFLGIPRFIEKKRLPHCGAAERSFNIDAKGNLSPCIERADEIIGNLKEESLAALLSRSRVARAACLSCSDCWTLCGGLSAILSHGRTLQVWRDLLFRF